MSNTSSFKELSRSSNEESIGKTLGATSASLEESSIEVTSPVSNVFATTEVAPVGIEVTE